jgi:peptidoglycan/LPS O-acetylase OafA/YrhL
MTDKESTYLPTLDGWRAVAILAVMIAHGTEPLFCPEGAAPNTFWYDLTRHGAKGVDIFFGISGFLICTRLLQEGEKEGRISLKNFYIRRVCRILPPYLIYFAGLSLLAVSSLIAINKWEWVSSLFLFRNYLSPASLGGWYTGHLWSLSVEEHFYLLWPFLLVLSGERRARRFVLPLALLFAIWRSFEFRHQLLMTVLPGVGFYGRTDIRLDALLLGCWAALLFKLYRGSLTRVVSPAHWTLAALLFIACVIIQPPMAMLWQSLLIPALLLGTVLHPKSYAGMLLETPLLRWIGRLSYSLYLWQQLFLVPHDIPRVPLGILQQWPWNLAAVFLCATASYYLIEAPMIRFGHRMTAPQQPSSWTSAAAVYNRRALSPQ